MNTTTTSGKQILIIDDEDAIRANLLRFLRMEGYVVREAINGRAGLESVRESRPDLILCDVMMPELDGFAVLKSIRGDSATAAIPFIFLTASVELDDQRFGHKLGDETYLAKPFNLPKLLELIRLKLTN